MRILVAGATGALGRQLVPRLVERGHEVVGMSRSAERAALLEEHGARAVVADALDPDSVARAVVESEPEAIVHELTSLAAGIDMRRFDASFEQTNRLRTVGTDHLLAAGRAAGVRRFVAQSYAGWPYAREGGSVKSEDAPLDPSPPAPMRTTLEAIRHLEEAVTGTPEIEGVVLRYGALYGPGTSLSVEPDGEHTAAIRDRRFPLVGDGAGVWSFVHVADAAEATAVAVERGAPGIYNVVDDTPAPVREWLPAAAEALGAKPPRRVPRWLGRLLAGEAAVVMMTEVRGASNAKARRELGWRPERRSLWEGLAAEAGR
ncbi:MAG TPA: NAD(P)-dependent oxidoreductase [Solirubrobacterales bacterium]|nr:NAD(P)-dependent oxidoreductase [Solirubrobacterales bacterium]